MSKRLRKPPGLRASKSCGTCQHWEWGYEGHGECNKHPESYLVRRRKGDLAGEVDIVSVYYPSSTKVCDDWS